MKVKLLLTEGETSRTACAQALLCSGVDEKRGAALSSATLAKRIGWCTDLVSGMASQLLADHWNGHDVNQLASGEDALGRKLPSNAWMALRRLGWSGAAAEDVRVNDRIVRMAQEQAGRVLRSAHWRAEVTAGVLATWPVDPRKRTTNEWDAVREAVPGGQHLPSSVIKSRTRQVSAYVRAASRMPADVFEMEDPPRVARMLLLAACDGQQASIARSEADPKRALLRLQLPTCPNPQSYRDWTWVACSIALPPTVPACAVLHLPTVRTTGGTVRADMTYSHAVPKARRTGHTVALGVDWGLNTLLSAGAVRLHSDGEIAVLGAGAEFRAAGVLAKQHRLRRQSEHLHAKVDHYQRLNKGSALPPTLAGKQDVLRDEIRHVSERRSNLNQALARAAARWVVDQAIAANATVIYLEDLRSMEARGMGRTVNTRLSQAVRGQIATHVRHLAAEVGVAVVTVPPRNTSKHCPQCLAPLRHCKAPDRPATPGWKWAICPNRHSCGWQGDRDQGAWRRIAARGLTHQTKTVADRACGAMVIRSVDDKLELKAVVNPTSKTSWDRSKTGPTRHRPTRPAPRRRRAPSSTRPLGPVEKCPEGRAPTGRMALPRAARRYQGATATSTPTIRHRPRGAALGAGFHLHAHASPPWWETIKDLSSNVRSLGWSETLVS
ncbi:transposase [Streptomyces olivochromogenes]|nr:transposase [Streptomyces olivochromogenes]